MTLVHQLFALVALEMLFTAVLYFLMLYSDRQMKCWRLKARLAENYLSTAARLQVKEDYARIISK